MAHPHTVRQSHARVPHGACDPRVCYTVISDTPSYSSIGVTQSAGVVCNTEYWCGTICTLLLEQFLIITRASLFIHMQVVLLLRTVQRGGILRIVGISP